MIDIGLVIIWNLLASALGYNEALHFYYRNSSTKNNDLNEHTLFTWSRILMWIPFEVALGLNGSWLSGLCLPFLFILMHDGFYYLKRNLLDHSYPNQFFAMTKTSDSIWDQFNLTHPVLRVIYYVIGISGLILIQIYK